MESSVSPLTADFDWTDVSTCGIRICPLDTHLQERQPAWKECPICCSQVPTTAMEFCHVCLKKSCLVCIFRTISTLHFNCLKVMIREKDRIQCNFCRTSPAFPVPVLTYFDLIYKSHADSFQVYRIHHHPPSLLHRDMDNFPMYHQSPARIRRWGILSEELDRTSALESLRISHDTDYSLTLDAMMPRYNSMSDVLHNTDDQDLITVGTVDEETPWPMPTYRNTQSNAEITQSAASRTEEDDLNLVTSSSSDMSTAISATSFFTNMESTIGIILKSRDTFSQTWPIENGTETLTHSQNNYWTTPSTHSSTSTTTDTRTCLMTHSPMSPTVSGGDFDCSFPEVSSVARYFNSSMLEGTVTNTPTTSRTTVGPLGSGTSGEKDRKGFRIEVEGRQKFATECRFI